MRISTSMDGKGSSLRSATFPVLVGAVGGRVRPAKGLGRGLSKADSPDGAPLASLQPINLPSELNFDAFRCPSLRTCI